MSGPAKRLKITHESTEDMIIPKPEASLTGIPRELRDMIFDHVFDNELIIWCTALTYESPARSCIIKGRRKHALINTNQQFRDELSSRAFRVYVRTNRFVPASAIRVPPFTPTPMLVKIRLDLDAVKPRDHNLNQHYRERVWRSSREFIKAAPKLKSLRIDVLRGQTGGWTAGEAQTQQSCFDGLIRELVKGHPTLRDVTLTLLGATTTYILQKQR